MLPVAVYVALLVLDVSQDLKGIHSESTIVCDRMHVVSVYLVVDHHFYYFFRVIHYLLQRHVDLNGS